MIVIGAKGFAKELLEVLVSGKYNYNQDNLFFFDNLNPAYRSRVFDKFEILKSEADVQRIFQNVSSEFCIGIGNPRLRSQLCNKFIALGGGLTTIVSSETLIGTFGTSIGKGTTIIGNAVITNDVKIGEGCLIYMNTSITHDVIIGDFVEISPGVSIAGRCSVGNFTSLGIGAIVLPDIKIGANCIIGAGTVIINDIADNSVVVGVPGKVIKNNY